MNSLIILMIAVVLSSVNGQGQEGQQESVTYTTPCYQCFFDEFTPPSVVNGYFHDSHPGYSINFHDSHPNPDDNNDETVQELPAVKLNGQGQEGQQESVTCTSTNLPPYLYNELNPNIHDSIETAPTAPVAFDISMIPVNEREEKEEDNYLNIIQIFLPYI